jgi:hypothetical protein
LRRLPDGVDKAVRAANSLLMSLKFAYQFREEAPRSGFCDLDVVVLTAPVVSDDGVSIPAGTEGTIVSVDDSDGTYLVEFPEPDGTLATVRSHEVSLVARFSS